jgi:hypothetical protein
MNIEYCPKFPPEIREKVEPILDDISWLVPGWCQRVVVFWEPVNQDRNSAFINVNYAYRFVQITICSDFLGQTEQEMRDDLLHELIHGFICPMADYAREIIDLYCPKDESPKTNEMLHRELTRKNEAITQDFTFVLAGKINES